MNYYKMTKVQLNLMRWLAYGWSAYRQGSAYFVNGSKICTESTVLALQKRGFVEVKEDCVATVTEEGRSAYFMPVNQA